MTDLASTLGRFLALTSVQIFVLAAFAAAAIRLGRVRGVIACVLFAAVLALPLLSPLGALLPAGARVEVPAGPLANLVDEQARPAAAASETDMPPPPVVAAAPPIGNARAEHYASPGPGPAPVQPDPVPSAVAEKGGAVETGGPGIGWLEILLFAWAGVVLVHIIRLAPAIRAHRRLIRRGRPVTDPRVLSALERAAREAHAPVPRLLAIRAQVVPFVSGILRPVLAIPERLLVTDRRDDLRLALLHELGHVRWRHALWISPEWLLKTAFFFHPLVHWAVRRFREEREYVCDRLVTSVTGRRSPYATFLLGELDLATRCRGVPSAALGTRRSRMSLRLDRIIEERSPTMMGRITGMSVLGLALATFFLVLALAPSPAGAEEKPDSADPKIEVAWTTKLNAPSFGESTVADVDGDGRLEVAFGTYFGDDSVRVLNGEDGSHYWQYDAGNACLDASLRFADLDGDGDLELVVPISNMGSVLALDLKQGTTVWNYTPQPVECTDSPPAILDVDGDGKPEVTYGTFAGRLHVIGQSGKGKRVLQVCKGFIQTGPAILDIDGDDTLDYVCATFKSDNTIYAVSGKTGRPIWTFKVEGDHVGMYHGCSVGDLDGDGKPELTIGAYNGKVYCLDAATGKVRWTAAPGDRFFMSPTVIADVTGDGKPEVLTASNQVTAISGDGKVLWTKPCARGGWDSATRGVSVADVDGDRQPDLVTLSGAGLLKVHRGSDGKLLYEFDAATLTEGRRLWGSSHGVTIADLTGDGRLDLFFVVGGTQPEKHGLAICLTGFAGKGRGWYMLRHDVRNTGNTATAHDPVLLGHIEGLTPDEIPIKNAPNRRQERIQPSRPPVARPTADRDDYTSAFDLAVERGVPKEVMEAAIAANRVDASRDSMEKVYELGGQAFVAICILIETGHGGSYTEPLLHGTWQLGLERLLLDLCERNDLPNYGAWTALRGLGAADTPQVREYLLSRLARERGAGLFMSAASALGKLREEKAIEPIGKQLLKFEQKWQGVERHLIWALQAMKSPAVIPVLIEYLDDDRAKCCLYALLALNQLDPDQAAKEGRRLILVEGRLDENSREYIEKHYPGWKPK